ncbi:MAG: hypothetical protein N4A57_03410 [Anaeromicrobium sp.]|jgi:hypothetical protein|uniref:hypothetical protein n=1 Tax=Anaeromicrobium sp. TaxID=1929132 RepID=UPI0025D385D8|nr:hypothetical protein [Anaeromicrobium sp.]MCT4593308.1 hypothetical protein [Anaeromicrobium sp.]
MNNTNEMVKYVKLNDDKKIEICVDESFTIFLQDPTIVTMIEQSCKSLLENKFMDLHINDNISFIKVQPGTEKESLEVVNNELINGIQMAMAFLSQMGTDSLG